MSLLIMKAIHHLFLFSFSLFSCICVLAMGDQLLTTLEEKTRELKPKKGKKRGSKKGKKEGPKSDIFTQSDIYERVRMTGDEEVQYFELDKYAMRRARVFLVVDDNEDKEVTLQEIWTYFHNNECAFPFTYDEADGTFNTDNTCTPIPLTYQWCSIQAVSDSSGVPDKSYWWCDFQTNSDGDRTGEWKYVNESGLIFMWEDILGRIDTNNDGKLSKAEIIGNIIFVDRSRRLDDGGGRCEVWCESDRAGQGDSHCAPGIMASVCGGCDYCDDTPSGGGGGIFDGGGGPCEAWCESYRAGLTGYLHCTPGSMCRGCDYCDDTPSGGGGDINDNIFEGITEGSDDELIDIISMFTLPLLFLVKDGTCTRFYANPQDIDDELRRDTWVRQVRPCGYYQEIYSDSACTIQQDFITLEANIDYPGNGADGDVILDSLHLVRFDVGRHARQPVSSNNNIDFSAINMNESEGVGDPSVIMKPNVEGETCLETFVYGGDDFEDLHGFSGGCMGWCGGGCRLTVGTGNDCMKHDICGYYKTMVQGSQVTGYAEDVDCGDEAAQAVINCWVEVRSGWDFMTVCEENNDDIYAEINPAARVKGRQSCLDRTGWDRGQGNPRPWNHPDTE